MELQENAPLSPLTTFNIGGSARFLLRVRTQSDVEEALAFARSKELPVFILGGGSNVLIDDAGFAGVVLKIEIMGLQVADTLVVTGAGENWDKVVARAVEQQLWGIENLSGIPGTVGGSAVQNIGAYGAALSQTVEWIEVFDVHTAAIKKFTNKECLFGYRSSVLKNDAGRYVVLRVALRLQQTPAPNLSYKDLAEAFANKTSPSLNDIRTVVLAIRAKKFPDITKEGTAGSFFKNPVLSVAEAEALRARYPAMPLFSLPEEGGKMKIPLAWLLDHVLHARGMRAKSARLFEAQPLVVVVTWPASSSDVVALAKEVQEKIHAVCGIEIEPEVHIVRSEIK